MNQWRKLPKCEKEPSVDIKYLFPEPGWSLAALVPKGFLDTRNLHELLFKVWNLPLLFYLTFK